MENKPDVTLGNVDAINNIETARMALRWALERLHVLESAKLEASERSTREIKWRGEAEEEVRRLKATISIKTNQVEERERYYKKVEEFLSLRLSGQVDIATLAQKAVEVEQLRGDLENRIGQLEREFTARRQSLELEYQRLNRQAREAAQAGSKEAQAWHLKRQEEWEKDHASKLVELKERDLRVAKQEIELAERQRRFEEFCSAQKVRLETQGKELEEQAHTRLKMAERLLEERQSSQESGWTREKALLLQEIALLRRKVQELSPALLEADRKAEDAVEALARAQENERRAEQKARLSGLNRGAELERLKELETQVESEITRRSELERKLAASQIAARNAESRLAEEREILAERARELEREKHAFVVAELEKDAPGRVAEYRRDFEIRLGMAEATFSQEKAALLEQLHEREALLAREVLQHERGVEELRARLTHEFEERTKSREEQTGAWEKARLEEAGQWRRRLEDAGGKIAALEGRVADAEARAQLESERANSESERRKSMAQHEQMTQSLWREEWEVERKSLIAKIAALEDSARHAREEGEAQLRQATARSEAMRMDLEQRHKLDIEAARLSQESWDQTHVREAAEWRKRAEDATARLLTLEERLLEAEKTELRAKEVEADAQRRVHESTLHREDMLRRMESDRQKERQDFERLLSQGDQTEAKLHEELRVAKLSLEDTERRRASELEEQRVRLKQELEDSWKARLVGEETLGERLRLALERVSELEKVLAQNDAIVRRAQDSLTDDAERHKRLQQEAAEARQRFDESAAEIRRGFEDREASLLSQVNDRETALNRRAAEIEAAAGRAATDYHERRNELERIKAEMEKQIAELIKKAR